MIRTSLGALALFALPLATPVAAQSAQEQLDARYDRALAAGYKALFLCSAIENAAGAGAQRTVESITTWELAGTQSPYDQKMADTEALVAKRGRSAAHLEGTLLPVSVTWDDKMPPRVAVPRREEGCSLLPIGTTEIPETLRSAEKPYLAEWDANLADPGLARLGFDKKYGDETRTTAVVVQRSGERITEAYADDFDHNVPQRTWSVAKSIAATLVGAAVQRGETDVSTSAKLGVDESDPRRAITIDHLLRMASGRYSDTPGNRTDPLYFGGSTVEETALHWPLIHAPDTVYRYANNDTLAAVKAIENTFAEHPPAAFFEKIGMHHTVAETDWQGDYILSSQVWSTARDLAKFGQLYLDDGVLPSGERILPEGWVEYVSAPSGPQPDGPFGYGAGFWLFNKSEGIPPDTFAAMGNRGQYVVIVPSRDVVIVRRGEDPAGSRFDIVTFTRDVLAALDD